MPGDPSAAPPPERPSAQDHPQGPGTLRVGLMTRAPRDVEIAADCADVAKTAGRLLESLGHSVEEAHPAALDAPEHIVHYVRVVMCNTARALQVIGTKVGRDLTAEDVEPLTWALAEQGRTVLAPEWLETIEYVHGFGRKLASFWHDDGFDLLVTPTMGMPPAEIGYLSSTREEPLRAFIRSSPHGVFTLPFNLSGQPAISLPLHWDDRGLPRGAHLVAAYGREDLLLRVAAQLERAAPWNDRLPPLFG